MPNKDEWEPISVIADRPATRGTMEVFTRNLTDTARIASRRQASGVASVLDFGGPSGSSIPGILATNSPVAAFLYTISRADKLSLFRYWCTHDAMVGRAIELHSELPMSRVTIGPPKGPSPRQNRQITRIYESMSERIDILGLMLEVSREYWMCGDVYLWCNWSEKLQQWDDVYCLPVEFCFLPQQHIRLTDGTTQKISSTCVGDEVISAAGVKRKVVKTYQREVDEEIVVIRSKYLQTPIRVTSNHEIHTERGPVPAGELTVEDSLLFQPPMNQVPQGDITDDHCLVMGWWLAEGSGNERESSDATDRINMVFDPNKDIDQKSIPLILESLERAFPPEQWRERYRENHTTFEPRRKKPVRKQPLHGNYQGPCPRCGANNEWLGGQGFTPNGEPRYKCYYCNRSNRAHIRLKLPYKCSTTYGQCDAVCYTNQEAYDFVHKEGGYGARYKKLSERWLYLPFEQQRILFQSWLFGDGEVRSNGSVTGVTTSRALRDQMHLIAVRLGIRCKPFAVLHGYKVDEEMIREIPVAEFGPSEFFYALYIPAYDANYRIWREEKTIKRVNKFKKNRQVVNSFSRSGHQWSVEEDGLMLSRYVDDGREILAREMGRAVWDVGNRAMKLGIVTIGNMKEPKVSEITESGAILLEIGSISKEKYTGTVYNIEVEEDHTYQVECVSVSNCHSLMHPFNRKKEIIFFAKPLVDTAAVRRITDRDMYMVADTDIEKLYEALGDTIPPELKEALNYGEAVPLNTNWRRGSYCIHVARNRAPNQEYGESIVERCMDTLLRLENLKNSNLQISSRNMNPKHIVTAPGTGKVQMDDLRAQIDLSMLEQVDYPIVTNFEVNWQTVGANERLLNTENEYRLLREDLALGLGSTVEMLTGQASYGGNRVTLEMMNTCYLTFRDKMRKLVEVDIFRPVADALGHYQKEFIDVWPRVEPEEIEEGDILSEEEDGQIRRKRTLVNVLWNHSTLRFNRISIRDNAEVYDQLFQLYQKGSLAVRYLLDLHNIDPEENARAILEDIGGPKDPVFNDFVRAVYTSTDMPQKILNDTDFITRVITGLKLNYRQPGTSSGESAGGGGGMGGGGLSDMGMLGGGGGEFGAPMGMPGEDGGMFGVPGEPGVSGGAGVGMGGEVVPGGTGGVPGVAPAPAPAASRRMGSREEDSEELLMPGRILSEAISLVVGRALREKAEEMELTHGRSLYPDEVKGIIKAVEVETRRRKSTANGKRVRNGNGTH